MYTYGYNKSINALRWIVESDGSMDWSINQSINKKSKHTIA